MTSEISAQGRSFLLSAEETETQRRSRWLKAAQGAAPPVAQVPPALAPVFQLSEQKPEAGGPSCPAEAGAQAWRCLSQTLQVWSVPKPCCPGKTALSPGGPVPRGWPKRH